MNESINKESMASSLRKNMTCVVVHSMVCGIVFCALVSAIFSYPKNFPWIGLGVTLFSVNLFALMAHCLIFVQKTKNLEKIEEF